MRDSDWSGWINRLQRLVGVRLEPALRRFMRGLSGNPSVRQALASAGLQEFWVRESVMLVPNVALLIGGLLRDPYIPQRTKVAFLASVGYVILPFDILPDRIPGLGQLDDLLVVTLGLHLLLNESNQVVVSSHWRGTVESLRVLQFAIHALAARVPEPVLTRVRDWAGGR